MAVKYRFNLRYPKFNWSIRNRSKTYKMSKAENNPQTVLSFKSINREELSKGSFIQNLEQDIFCNSGSNRKCKMGESEDECLNIFQPILAEKMKMIHDQSNLNVQDERGTKSSVHSKEHEYFKEKLSQLVHDIQKHEKTQSLYESSSNCNALSLDSASSNESKCFSDSFSQGNAGYFQSDSSGNDSSASSKDENITHKSLNSNEIADSSFKDNGLTDKKPNKKHFNQFTPIEIKVHVVECTVTTNEGLPEETGKGHRNGYRRHSNSLITAHYENIDFTKMLHHKTSKTKPMHKFQCNLTSKMYLISENEELEYSCPQTFTRRSGSESLSTHQLGSDGNTTSHILYKLAKPSILAIIYMKVLHEFTLCLLLLIFSDIALDDPAKSISYDFVLVAFGLGGVAGRLSCQHWGHKLLADGSHAASAVIFLLNGLSVAGILWSGNIFWLSGFYALLGFIECGIIYTIPRLVDDYIEPDTTKLLILICKSLSSLVFLCIPFAIGLSKDVVGDYDNLLRVTSCLSVVCAVLCYFLPRMSSPVH